MQEDNNIRQAEPDFSMTPEQRPPRHRTPSSRSDAKPPRGVGFLWFALLFLLLVAVAAGGYWQLMQLQQTLQNTRQQLQVTREQLSQVTGQVSKTGENITTSDLILRSELKEMNSEIRKLWDVSNKRNRQWITENKEKLAQSTKRLNVALEQVEAMKKSAGQRQSQLNKALAEMEQKIKAVSAEQLVTSSEMTARLEANRVELKALQAASSTAMQQVEKAAQQHQSVVQTQDELRKKLGAYQSQVAIRLQQLENTLRQIKAPKEGGLIIQ